MNVTSKKGTDDRQQDICHRPIYRMKDKKGNRTKLHWTLKTEHQARYSILAGLPPIEGAGAESGRISLLIRLIAGLL